MEALTLAIFQFATSISFHILFPTVTVALGWLLLHFTLRYRWSGSMAWRVAYRFWMKVFALAFALS